MVLQADTPADAAATPTAGDYVDLRGNVAGHGNDNGHFNVDDAAYNSVETYTNRQQTSMQRHAKHALPCHAMQCHGCATVDATSGYAWL